MERVKIMLLIAILGVASTIEAAPRRDYKDVINAFIESRINTDYMKMKGILSQDAVEKVPRLKTTFRFSAVDLLKTMKASDGVKQACTSSFKTLAENDGMIMVQIDFIYAEHIVSEFVTLERDTREDWKVSQINKFFKIAPEDAKRIASNN